MYELQHKAGFLKDKRTPDRNLVLEARVAVLEIKTESSRSGLTIEIILLFTDREAESDGAVQTHDNLDPQKATVSIVS